MTTHAFAVLLALAPAAEVSPKPDGAVRFAAFNVRELSREKLDRVDGEGRGADEQLRNAAAIVQAVRPDVLLVSEIDFDEKGEAAKLFLTRYLNVPQEGREAIDYPRVVAEPVNTGVPSGMDLNNDGDTSDPEDAWGFGRYPGQYGMALYSRFPIDRDQLRTFRLFRWRDMPRNVMPDGREERPAWYPEEVASRLRLSSKTHMDVPAEIGGTTVHVLAAHPTPPVFDGAEDRNGRRNWDEIRLIADYVTGGESAAYLVDDQGRRGGLPADAKFVVMGDMNSDPDKGAKLDGRAAVTQLLSHPRVQDPAPTSRGAVEMNPRRPAEVAATVTSDFGRLDYVLPSKGLKVVGSGVFWPAAGESLSVVVAQAKPSSDHCLVWVDLVVGTGE